MSKSRPKRDFNVTLTRSYSKWRTRSQIFLFSHRKTLISLSRDDILFRSDEDNGEEDHGGLNKSKSKDSVHRKVSL